ncbi:MAG TPA: hypothetical protein VKR06_12780 [Ktedonosporobacter sp.]|nr:hypothetical protein [Ktedonosporobacter sp.]
MMYNDAPQPRRRGGRNPLPGIIFLLIIIGGIGFFAYKLQTGNVITVDSGATLFIDQCTAGFVHIHASGSPNQVVIQGPGGLFVPSSHAQDSDTIIINGCNLDMTVPASINLNITADAIEVFGVSGQMNLSTNGGSIVLIQDTLKGKSKIDNNGGPTIFQGSIDSAASPILSSNGGTLDISVPRDATFHLKISGILETLTTNIPGLASTNGQLPDMNIGASSQAMLTLDVNGAQVVLRQGS